jgi:anti-sigma factor RsiW
MNFNDQELMAYADGELDAQRRRAIEAALAADAALRARVAALRAQREQVAAAYAEVLDDPVPARLRALLERETQQQSAEVVDLAAARARSTERRAAPRLTWMQWGGMAATLVLGLLLGLQFAPRGDGDALLGERGGQLVAGGALAQVLSTQLASEPPAAPAVAVQLSFVDKGGRYCRTFSSARIAGLACRDATQWTVLVSTPAAGNATPAMRQAAASLPRAVLDAVDTRIEGNTLNAAQERDARAQNWTR